MEAHYKTQCSPRDFVKVLIYTLSEVICLPHHFGGRGYLALFYDIYYKWILLKFNVLSLIGLMWGSFPAILT